MRGFAVFDVDHTLIRRSSGGRFIARAMKEGVLPQRLIFVVAWYSLTYKLGFFRLRPFEEGFPYLRGLRRSDLERIAKESFETSMKADLFEGAVNLVRQEMEGGREVVLATSSLDFIVRPLAAHLGVSGLLSTSLEFVDGASTGRMAGEPMFRKEKRARVLAFLGDRGVKASDCSFYSDSIYDLPLLESVGTPVAVNPDFRLRRIAKDRGWTIIDLR